MTIKCGIINNDALAINVLKSYIDKMPETELVIASQNALKIRSRINKETIDLLFLDVEIPDISGYEFLQTLINPPKIIITSGSKKYAAEAFELDVLDYIVMPAVFKRFLTAIKKYQKQNLVVYETPALINYLFLKENKKW